MNVHFNTVNGQLVAWTDATIFFVEWAHGAKSSYRDIAVIREGDLRRAVKLYNKLPAGEGRKKRLKMWNPGEKAQVLARAT